MNFFFIQIFREDARFLKSKIAQIFALTFIVDYPLKVNCPFIKCTPFLPPITPTQWPTFFSDLLEIVESGDVWSVELYLRVLLAIDSEVVDRQIVHTQEVGVGEILSSSHIPYGAKISWNGL